MKKQEKASLSIIKIIWRSNECAWTKVIICCMISPDKVFVTLSPNFVRSNEKHVRKLLFITLLKLILHFSSLKTGIISISSINAIIGDIASVYERVLISLNSARKNSTMLFGSESSPVFIKACLKSTSNKRLRRFLKSKTFLLKRRYSECRM